MNKQHSGKEKCFIASLRRGFTLIELLVVVLIIGILAAVALPQYQKAVKKSRYAQMMVVGRALRTSADAYYMANGKYPAAWDEVGLSVPGAISPDGKTLSFNGYACRLYMSDEKAMDSFLCSRGTADNYLGYRIVLSASYLGKQYCLAYAGNETQENFCKSMGGHGGFDNGNGIWHYELP